ncbi:MAG TPA: FtsX-like permease family protein [Thermoanaerobaculia bacterium]|nr:FtsX-like permease family protein [Thermoanaerobaculia bacterium]
MREVADDTLERERSLAVVLNGFAALAMLLSGLGVYGTMSFRVARRIGEIGVRMALGADRWSVLRGVLAESATAVVPPVLAGLLLASLGNRALANLTFEVSPVDPITLVAVAAGVLTLALGAGLPAAWRAARIDPARSLQP